MYAICVEISGNSHDRKIVMCIRLNLQKTDKNERFHLINIYNATVIFAFI